MAGNLITPSLEPVDKPPLEFLDNGFKVAVSIASICLLSGAAYLFYFTIATNQSMVALANGEHDSLTALQLGLHGRAVTARLVLLSCGVFVGMSFGFLGFALFLLGVRGAIEAKVESESYQIHLSRLSPGVFVILVSAVLVGFCATRKVDFLTELEGSSAKSSLEAPETPSPSPEGLGVLLETPSPEGPTGEGDESG